MIEFSHTILQNKISHTILQNKISHTILQNIVYIYIYKWLKQKH